MNNSISAFPQINPLNFFKLGNREDPLLSQPEFYFYASGRASVYYGMKMTDLPEDSVVLVPSFNCGVEIEGILRAGYRVEFYKIKKNLEIDYDDLKSCVTEKTKGLMIIHYFGFPQKMEKVIDFCDKKKLLLIEDCGHALYSQYNNKWLGTFGDFSFFSLQKTIALPNGGGLLCRRAFQRKPKPGIKYFELSFIKSTIRSILEFNSRSNSLIGRLSAIIIKAYLSSSSVENTEESDADPKDMRWYYDVARYDYTHAMSALSKLLVAKDDFKTIIKKRRQNYFFLEEKLSSGKKINRVHKNLEEGVCPLSFVIEIENRDHIVEKMGKENIFPFVFGRFPHPGISIEEYVETKYLSENLIGLPIHHQLGEDELARIANFLLHPKDD